MSAIGSFFLDARGFLIACQAMKRIIEMPIGENWHEKSPYDHCAWEVKESVLFLVVLLRMRFRANSRGVVS